MTPADGADAQRYRLTPGAGHPGTVFGPQYPSLGVTLHHCVVTDYIP